MNYIIKQAAATTLIAGVVLIGASPGHGATITTKDTLILVAGEMTIADIEAFRTVAMSMPDGSVVVLSSSGGAALAGIRIGELIRKKRFMTFVAKGTYCASACATAWLGGVGRYISTQGRVGFHGVYDTTTKQQSGPGNALVGAYLDRIGLSDKAIWYITSKGFDDVQWLTAQDATALGIDAFVTSCAGGECSFTSTATHRTETIPISVPSAQQIEKNVAEAIQDFLAAWSSTGAGDLNDQKRQSDFLGKLNTVYTDIVNYYGKALPKNSVVADKQAFMKRWPRRDYRIRPGTLSVKCKSGTQITLCYVLGAMDYNVSSAIRSTGGAASFQYTIWIEQSDGATMISSEDSKVIERH